MRMGIFLTMYRGLPAMNVKEIGEAALALPPDERAMLAELLRASLEPPVKIKYRKEWEMEIEKRIDAFRRGEMKAYTREEVMRELGKLS
jgi:putative addiction module component (TIGR02574 family)